MGTLTHRLSAVLPLYVLCAAGALTCPASNEAEGRIRQIIDNVLAHEGLYENVEVRMVEHYEMVDRKPRGGKVGENTLHTKWTIDKDLRYVSQNGMFRVEVEGQSTTAEHKLSEDRTRIFDGDTTRVLDQKHVGNIIRGRKNDENFVRPHMLLLRSNLPMLSLSTYLHGHVAVMAVPDFNWDPDHVIDAAYQGEAEIDGLKCHKVSTTISLMRNKGKKMPFNRLDLWLAEDRNYLPVRFVGYDFYWSRTIPIDEGRVASFREIEPGIWYPVGATRVHYHGMTLEKEGRQKPWWRHTYQVKDVSLNPNYDISFFRDLIFPPGTSVYEVENDNIIKSYVAGQAEAPDASHRRWLWWLLWLNVATLLAIVPAVYVRKRHKRRGADARLR